MRVILSKQFSWGTHHAWSDPIEVDTDFDLYLGSIMMEYPGPKYKNPKRLGQTTQSLYINVDNVDKHFARARKEGAAILEEPKDTFYGHRRYGAADPEGHEWYFAQEIKTAATRKRAARQSKPKRSQGCHNER